MSYDFTGGNWKGSVDESVLNVTFHLPGTYVAWADGPIPAQQNNTLSYRWTNWQAEKEFTITFFPTRPDAWRLNDEKVEIIRAISSPNPASQNRRVPGFPPCIEKQGVMYVELSQFAHCLAAQRKAAGIDGSVTSRWNDNTWHGTLTAGKTTLTFTLKQPTVAISGGKPLALPGRPFLNKPIMDRGGEELSDLYIPLKPLAEYFGGTVHTSIRLPDALP